MSRKRLFPTVLGALLLSVAGHLRAADPTPPPPVPKSRDATPLPNTAPLTMEGDIASAMIDGIDKFLLGEIDRAMERRSVPKDPADEARLRERLAHILGVRDARVPFDSPELLARANQSSLVAKGTGYDIHAARWPAFGQVHGEGLLAISNRRGAGKGFAIVIPDSSQTPEQLMGLAPDVDEPMQIARKYAEDWYSVAVPAVINRQFDRKAGITNRVFLYRSAFELGRHLIGYEVQKVLAIVDWIRAGSAETPIVVAGWGDGGMIALYAGALDPRINTVHVAGYFDDRRTLWREPIDRNVFGLFPDFSDAQLACMIGRQGQLVIESRPGPEVILRGGPGAPAELRPAPRALPSEIETARRLARAAGFEPKIELLDAPPEPPNWPRLERTGPIPDAKARHARQLDELDRHTQKLLAESAEVRKKFMAGLDTSSLEKHGATVEKYRKTFYEQVIGKFDHELLPLNARSREAYDAEKWIGYEVVLDVFPDVFAYGLLLVPKDLKEGEKRPVVVTQHGLEGRPQDTIGPDKWSSYKAFSAHLADRGFIVFSPQNPYIFRDRFRTLQRKANPLGRTLFSIIVPQHQQILNWLKTLPNVDGKRIGFYGLSYGGKTAMRVPAILTDYCLSICSADFNEWIWKNASSDPANRYSYVWTIEYEIFEFDLGATFNYSDMAALIAPRPFMVERGHFDGVAPDEMVAYEYAKVRNLYASRLNIPDRTEIEWFVGPHTINGKGTFDFLHKHLHWPKPD